MKTSDIMTRDVITISPGHSVLHAARIMQERGISGLPVVDDSGRLVGMLTEGDLMARVEPDSAEDASRRWLHFAVPEGLARQYVISHSWRVSDVMSAPVVTVSEETSLRDVADLIRLRDIRRLPVVREGRIVGIVSRADLLKAVIAAEDRAAPVGRGDDAIRVCIEARIGDARHIISGEPKVTVTSGVVHLWGTVGSKAERDALRVVAESVPNITGVEDHTAIG